MVKICRPNRRFSARFARFSASCPAHLVGQCGRRGLVDDAHHSQAGNDAGVFGLALCVVEVGLHRNEGVSNRLALVGVGRRFHLRQHH